MNVTLTVTIDESTLAMLTKVLGLSTATVSKPVVPKNVPEYKHGKWQNTFLRMNDGETVSYTTDNIGGIRSSAVYWNRKYGNLIGRHMRVSKWPDGTVRCTKLVVA